MNPINISAVNKVRGYREKGLSLREISKIMEKDLKQIQRWNKYVVDNSGRKTKQAQKQALTVE